MALHLTVVPASTQVGSEAIRLLLNSKSCHKVRGYYRSLSKVPSQFDSDRNFTAVRGDVSHSSDIDFEDSDAVFYIPPPTYDGADSVQFAKDAAYEIQAAISKAGSVKRLVVISAIGAHREHGIGILATNHVTEEILRNSVPEVIFVKPAWFMENWASALGSREDACAVLQSIFTPIDHKIPMISAPDVGRICFEKLIETGQSLPYTPYPLILHGPQAYSAIDVKEAVESLTGKKFQIDAIEPDQLVDFFAQKLQPQYALEIAEMVTAMLPGGILDEDMRSTKNLVRGTTELREALAKYARGETSKAPSGAF